MRKNTRGAGWKSPTCCFVVPEIEGTALYYSLTLEYMFYKMVVLQGARHYQLVRLLGDLLA